MKSSTHKLVRVFVWELPVRVYHWLNALTILALCITGYLIGKPLNLVSNEEATNRYLFGWVRYIHFVAAYVFFFNFLVRIYWGFVGNKYASWRNFIPTSKKFLQEIGTVLRVDVLLKREVEHISIGHNAMAGFIYFLMFLMFLVQCITGFGLYAGMSDFWFAKMFLGVSLFLGGDVVLRELHHTAMWGFILFSIIHIYLVFYHDYVEGRGEISSMASGHKFVEMDEYDKNI